MLHKLFIFVAIILFSACASQSLTPVDINVQGDLQFSGKGSAAGVMLMSSMGPAGIAIGIAIDTGIAKDITETAVAGDVDLEAIIKTELYPFLQVQTHPVTINIERHGFLIWSGEGQDPTTAQLHLSINTGGDVLKVRYPDDFDQETFVFQTADLDAVKNHAHNIERLLSYAASAINEKLLQ